MAIKNGYFLWMVNFPQFCLKDLDFFFFLILKAAQKHLSRPSKYLRAILVILELKVILIILKLWGALWSFCRFWVVFWYFGHLLALMEYFNHFGWSDCVNRVNQSFPLCGYNNMCPLCNQIEIQNLTIGLEECGKIFVFVNYSDNQIVRLWEQSSQILQKFVKVY